MTPASQESIFSKLGPLAAQISNQGQRNKGLCLYCGEVFNLKDWHHEPDVCPDCTELFEDQDHIEGEAA